MLLHCDAAHEGGLNSDAAAYPLDVGASLLASCIGSSIKIVAGSTSTGLPRALFAGAEEEAPGSCGTVRLMDPVP